MRGSLRGYVVRVDSWEPIGGATILGRESGLGPATDESWEHDPHLVALTGQRWAVHVRRLARGALASADTGLSRRGAWGDDGARARQRADRGDYRGGRIATHLPAERPGAPDEQGGERDAWRRSRARRSSARREACLRRRDYGRARRQPRAGHRSADQRRWMVVLDGLPAGDWLLRALGPGGETGESTVRVSAGSVTDAVIKVVGGALEVPEHD